MSRIVTIAANTLREALRNRVLYLILFFAVLVILSSELLSLLTIGDRQRIVEDVGMGGIQLFGLIACIFLGISLLSREIDRRTIYAVLSKPLSRSEFVLGKALGLYATVLLVTALMALVFAVYLGVRFEGLGLAVARALAMFAVEFLVVSALALLMSASTTPILAGLLTSALVVIGHLSYGLKMLAGDPALEDRFAVKVLMALYYLLPNLERFNLKSEAIYRDPVGADLLMMSAGYGVAYAAALLLATSLVFERRDFV